MRENAVAAVEPAVRSPCEGVERFVSVLPTPAIEQNLCFPGGLRLIAIRNGNEQKMGRGADPHAAEAHFNAADEVQSFDEYRPAVELAITICVLEHDDAILAFALLGAIGIGVSFGNPKSPAVVEGEGNGLLHVGFSRKHRGFETGRHCHYFDSLFGRRARELQDVRRRHFTLLGEPSGVQGVGEHWPLCVELEVVEVDVTPAAAFLVHKADENVFAEVGLQIYDDWTQVFSVGASDFENDVLGIGAYEFHTRVFVRAARDQEAGEWMGDREGHRSERAFWLIAVALEGADPIVSLVLTLHVAATDADRVAFDGLLAERGPFGGPVLQRAGFKIQIERGAVATKRFDARRGLGREGGGQEDGAGQRAKEQELFHVLISGGTMSPRVSFVRGAYVTINPRTLSTTGATQFADAAEPERRLGWSCCHSV